MVGVACVIGGQGCIFYLLYRIGEYSIPCHWRLFVIITTLLQSMEGTYHGQMCIAMLVAHLVLSVLAALWHMWCLYVCVDSENASILCKS